MSIRPYPWLCQPKESELELLRVVIIACIALVAVACGQVGSLVESESEPPPKLPTEAEVQNRGKILALTEKNLWPHVRDCPRALPIIREFVDRMEQKYPSISPRDLDFARRTDNLSLAWRLMDDFEAHMINLSDACRR